jgi:hypothetical protein
MEPEVALVTAGVETDVLGIGYGDLDPADIDAVTAAHPRPDFKRQILAAFTSGFKDRPPPSARSTLMSSSISHPASAGPTSSR